MKKVILLFIAVIGCFLCFDSKTAVAAKENQSSRKIHIEMSGRDDFENALDVIETEVVYGSPDSGNGLMALNSYEEKSFERIRYVNVYTEDGFRITLFAVKLHITAHFYENGKVYLYSLGTSSYTYEDGLVLHFARPQIVNTDGSYSEGTVLFSMDSPKYGISNFKAWVKLRENSTDVETGLYEVE